jgi:hypothetical protein
MMANFFCWPLYYYSGHGILANIFLTFLKKNDVNQSLVSLINDNY